MNENNPQSGRRIALSAGLAISLLSCAIFFLMAADSGTANINIDIDSASWPWVIGWFLAADGLLSFFGGLFYLAFKIPRLSNDPSIAELHRIVRANQSAIESEAATRAMQAARARVWRLGFVFMGAGAVSLVAAVLLLTGVIVF